jgi:guanine deaminase
MSEAFLREAVALGRAGMLRGDGGPFGALVVVAGQVVGRGCNQVLRTNDPTAHAEVVAIRDATTRLGRFHLADAEIYASCEPCPMCLGAVAWARIPRLYYGASRYDAERGGFSDAEIYREFAREPRERAIQARQILADEARTLFDDWARFAGRRLY